MIQIHRIVKISQRSGRIPGWIRESLDLSMSSPIGPAISDGIFAFAVATTSCCLSNVSTFFAMSVMES